MALEISIWEEKPNLSGQKQTSAQQTNCNLLGDTIIPLEIAIQQNRGSEWWPLLSVGSNQQLNTSKQPNVNNFSQIAQPNKLNTLQANQLQDRCNSAEYLRKSH